jgi:hypothetical protein
MQGFDGCGGGAGAPPLPHETIRRTKPTANTLFLIINIFIAIIHYY